MVKRLLPAFAVLILLAGLGLAAAGFWLLRTPGGAHWLLTTAASMGGARLEIGAVAGSLSDDLRLQELHLRQGETDVRLERLHLRWQPRQLLQRVLAISRLSLEGGTVTLAAKEPPAQKEPFEFSWPQLPAWLLRTEAVLEALHLKDIVVLPAEGEPRYLERLTARLSWSKGVAEVSLLDSTAEGYRLQGAFAAGFAAPLLRLDLQLDLPQAVAEVERLLVKAELAEDAGAVLRGPVTLHGRNTDQEVLSLSTDLALRPENLSLSDFQGAHAVRGVTVTGDGEVALAAPFSFSLQVQVEDGDLARQMGVATDLGAELEIAGTFEDYEGRFLLSSHGDGWLRARLGGRLSGTAEEVLLSNLDGAWLGGALSGEVEIGWRDRFRLQTELQGRGFDPEVFEPQWPGEVNLDLEGTVTIPPDQAPLADVRGTLLDSQLRGRPLTGRADLSLRGKEVRISELELHGDGFDFAAQGTLSERVDFVADVRRLGGLLPGAKGSLLGDGWVRRRGKEMTGSLALRGREIAVADLRLATLEAEVNRPGRSADIRLSAGGATYGGLMLDILTLSLQGTPERHELVLEAAGERGSGELWAVGAWTGAFWSGELRRLQGQSDEFGAWSLRAPVSVEAGSRRLQVAPLQLAGGEGMTLRLAADLAGAPLRGTAEGSWREIDLILLRPWLPETLRLQGRSGGEVNLLLADTEGSAIDAQVTAAGQLAAGDFVADFSQVSGILSWKEEGLRAELTADLEEGGRLQVRLDSAEAPFALPQRGNLSGVWEGIELTRLRPWLPANLRVAGELSGQTSGQWLPGGKLSLEGSAGIGRGEIAWREDDGEVSFALRTAEATWRWSGQSLEGSAEMTLAEIGRIEGSFRLPLPAALPTAPLPQGPLLVRLDAQMREQGLLAALFPGLLRESAGEMAARLRVGGTWNSPDLNGSLELNGAGAYLPAAGIELEEVEVRAELAGQRLRLVSFAARSGPGRLEGTGEIKLDRWRPTRYRATLKGERFRLINLPELQALVTPDLVLDGTTEELTVRGAVALPELILIEQKKPEMIEESADVVVVGDSAPAEERDLPIALDLGIKVTLGKRVLIKYAGVDARLAGELDLLAEGENINARGEIRVAEGIYSAYGVRLRVVRGRILFAGGPVDRPTLDILALRTIGEVKAGVQVGGTPREPVVKLYSDPAMPDTDVLAYVVLGHPLGGDRQNAGLLMGAAGALLSHGESVMLQDRLKSQLGVDVLTVESGDGEVAGSVVTIGKYLSPRLYISYGQSLFAGINVAKLRYEISEHWQLESKMGEESGVDLYYKIEFR